MRKTALNEERVGSDGPKGAHPSLAGRRERLAAFLTTRRSAVVATIAAAATVVSIVLRLQLPILAVGSGGDDLLFVRGANSLRGGHWLGPLDFMTLSKGPAYPGFIALMRVLALPLKFGEQVTYLLAAGALCAGVGYCLRRPYLAVTAYVALALMPDNFDLMHAVVLRDGWYASLSLLLPALLFAVLLATRDARRTWLPLTLAATTGFTAAAFWLCREEGVWILPTLAVLIGWYAVSQLRRRRHVGQDADNGMSAGARLPGRTGWRLAAVLTVLLVAAAVPVGAVMVENQRNYGAALTNDMTSGQIARAYAQWLRVKAGAYQPRVPVTHAQREAVYRISPSAAELKTWLDDRPNGWKVVSCVRGPDGVCDFNGSVFIWALRNAAQTAGHFKTETDVQAFFKRIADDIQRACVIRQLQCAPDLPVVLQPLIRLHGSATLADIRQSVVDVVTSSSFGVGPAAVDSRPTDTDWANTHAAVPAAPSSLEQAQLAVAQYRHHDWPYRLLSDVHRLLFPIFLVLGLIGTALALHGRYVRRSPLAVLSLALLIGALTRFVLVSVTSTTEFASGLRYQLPTRNFLIATAVLGTVVLVDTLLRATEQRRHQS